MLSHQIHNTKFRMQTHAVSPISECELMLSHQIHKTKLRMRTHVISPNS